VLEGSSATSGLSPVSVARRSVQRKAQHTQQLYKLLTSKHHPSSQSSSLSSAVTASRAVTAELCPPNILLEAVPQQLLLTAMSSPRAWQNVALGSCLLRCPEPTPVPTWLRQISLT
jgi:hypothetical protein